MGRYLIILLLFVSYSESYMQFMSNSLHLQPQVDASPPTRGDASGSGTPSNQNPDSQPIVLVSKDPNKPNTYQDRPSESDLAYILRNIIQTPEKPNTTPSTYHNVNPGSVTPSTPSTYHNVNPGSVTPSTYHNVNPGSVTPSTYHKVNPGSVTPSTYPNVNPGSVTPSTYHNVNPGSVTPSTYHNVNPGSVTPSTYPNVNPGSVTPSTYHNVNPGSVTPSTYPNVNPGSVTPSTYPNVNPGTNHTNRLVDILHSLNITPHSIDNLLDKYRLDKPTSRDYGTPVNSKPSPVHYADAPQTVDNSGNGGYNKQQTSVPRVATTSVKPRDCMLRTWPGKLSSYYYVIDESLEVPCAPGTVFSQSHCVCIHDPLGMVLNLDQPIYNYDQAACYLKTVSGRPTEYLNTEINQVMSCSPGTIFSQQLCTCSHRDEDEIYELSGECKANYDLDFEKSWLQNDNPALPVGGGWTIKLQNGTGVFNTKSAINFWYYQGRPFDKTFSIQMEFKDLPSNQIRQSLLTNCGTKLNKDQPSLLIELNKKHTDNCHLRIVVVTGLKGQTYEMTLPVRSGEYNMLSLEYNRGYISAFIGYESGQTVSNQLNCAGDIEPSIFDLRLGSCDNKNNGFVGLIDWFKLYPCIH